MIKQKNKMLDISTGRLILNETEGWEISPFLTRSDLMESSFWRMSQGNTQNIRSNAKNLHINKITIDEYVFSMEIHIGRNDFIDEITLRSERASEIQQWSGRPGWEAIAKEEKQIHEEFLRKATSLPTLFTTDKDEQTIETNWGSISSIMDLSSEPDIRISIRYRNLSAAEKEKYLSLGRKYLHGEK